MNMERRKAPRLGDLVSTCNGLAAMVVECEGIHLWLRLLAIPWPGHSGRIRARRDSVDVISRARQ